MTFNQDPNAPDFAAIYAGTPAATSTPDLTVELAEIGVTSLTGMDDTQLQDIANRLQVHRNQKVAQQAAAQQLAQTNAQAQIQYLQASTDALNAQTAELTKPAEAATPKMTPDAWLAYLQKVGPKGYGGDPADYANAVYDAHYQVASAGATGEGTAPAAAAGAPAAPAAPGAATGSTRTETGTVPEATMASLQHYLDELRAVKAPTAEQSSKLATYEARQILYQGQNAGIAAGTVAQPTSPAPAAQAPAAPTVQAPAPVVPPITQPTPAAPVAQPAPAAPVVSAPAVAAPPVQSDATLADWASRGWRGY